VGGNTSPGTPPKGTSVRGGWGDTKARPKKLSDIPLEHQVDAVTCGGWNRSRCDAPWQRPSQDAWGPATTSGMRTTQSIAGMTFWIPVSGIPLGALLMWGAPSCCYPARERSPRGCENELNGLTMWPFTVSFSLFAVLCSCVPLGGLHGRALHVSVFS
jgi:hypothetical protein